MTTSITVERLLPCGCLSLVTTPFPMCPECGGEGEAYREIEVMVEYSYHRASRGARDSCGGVRGAGPPLEPDEPASCEIESVTDGHGVEVELSERERERAEEACEQDVRESAIDAVCSRYED